MFGQVKRKYCVLAAVLALQVTPKVSQAQDYYFGNFEDDVMFNGQYVLDQGAEGYAGWRDWHYPDAAPIITSASPSTTTGVTTGVNSIAWQPTSAGYHQGLTVKIQDLPAATRDAFFDAFFNNTHLAMNVTWDNNEWDNQYAGDGWNGAQVGLAINYGPGGTYQDQSFPDVDTGNAGTPGHWDLTNYSGVHNRIVMWDYSAHKAAIQNLYDTAQLDETSGWLEFMLYTNKGNFALPVTFFIDSWRLTSLDPEGLAGDYNGDGAVNAADYTVWRNNLGSDASAFEAGSRDPENTGVINGDDYLFWKDNYGNVAAGAGGLAGTVVPEPSSALMALVVAGLINWRRRSASR